MKTSFENQENRKSRVSAALTQGVAQAVQAAELVLPMVDLREKGLPPGFQAAQPLRRGRFQIGRRLLPEKNTDTLSDVCIVRQDA